jgi:heterotetrameric sarcosine oxidase gamma subunit
MILEARSTFGQTFGAEVPLAGFPSSGVAAKERGDIGCLLVNAAVDVGQIVSAASAAAGVELPQRPGAVSKTTDRLALWLTPRSWLVQCRPESESALAKNINDAFPDKTVHAASFTDYLCWIEISGAQAIDVVREGGFVSLEQQGLAVDHAKRTVLAGVPVVVVRSSVSAWLLGVERSRAPYFAEWLRACAA